MVQKHTGKMPSSHDVQSHAVHAHAAVTNALSAIAMSGLDGHARPWRAYPRYNNKVIKANLQI